jgi:hypothetical protein
MIRSVPWSLRLLLLLVLAGAGAFAWGKRPWAGDAEKVCEVAKLSGCPEPERSLVGNECKIAWLERSMWSFDRLEKLPGGGEPGGGDFLRALAREAGISACPEADAVDRELAIRRQQAEAAQDAPAEPEPEDTDDDGPAIRISGIVKSEAPAVDGELDPSVVSREVRARIGAIRACYERALKRKPSLGGKLKMRWTITPAGKVSGVEVEEDVVGDAELAACIKGLIGRWRFLAPSGGSVEVVYPFLFQPTKEKAHR